MTTFGDDGCPDGCTCDYCREVDVAPKVIPSWGDVTPQTLLRHLSGGSAATRSAVLGGIANAPETERDEHVVLIEIGDGDAAGHVIAVDRRNCELVEVLTAPEDAQAEAFVWKEARSVAFRYRFEKLRGARLDRHRVPAQQSACVRSVSRPRERRHSAARRSAARGDPSRRSSDADEVAPRAPAHWVPVAATGDAPSRTRKRVKQPQHFKGPALQPLEDGKPARVREEGEPRSCPANWGKPCECGAVPNVRDEKAYTETPVEVADYAITAKAGRLRIAGKLTERRYWLDSGWRLHGEADSPGWLARLMADGHHNHGRRRGVHRDRDYRSWGESSHNNRNGARSANGRGEGFRGLGDDDAVNVDMFAGGGFLFSGHTITRYTTTDVRGRRVVVKEVYRHLPTGRAPGRGKFHLGELSRHIIRERLTEAYGGKLPKRGERLTGPRRRRLAEAIAWSKASDRAIAIVLGRDRSTIHRLRTEGRKEIMSRTATETPVLGGETISVSPSYMAAAFSQSRGSHVLTAHR